LLLHLTNIISDTHKPTMPKYRIKHITKYTYANQVIDSENQVMLFPIDDAMQEVKKHDLHITHQPTVEVFTDYFGNKTGIFSVIKPHNELTIESQIEVITHEAKAPETEEDAAAQWANLEQISEQFPYIDFLFPEHCHALNEITAAAASLTDKNLPPFKAAEKMSAYVYENFEYKKGITNIETKVDEIWKLRAGVCQDFAHVLLVMLRIAGIPARYVSGYICPKGQELRGEGATHAWAEAYIPFYGWLGLDPTNNCIASDRHVRLAIGRNFSDCTPVKGAYKGSSEHTLEVSVTIENGAPEKKEKTDAPVFTYKVHNPATPANSYRHFMEMQQQQ